MMAIDDQTWQEKKGKQLLVLFPFFSQQKIFFEKKKLLYEQMRDFFQSARAISPEIVMRQLGSIWIVS